MKTNHSYFTIQKPVNLDLPTLLAEAGDFEIPKRERTVIEKLHSNRSNDNTIHYVSKGNYKVKQKTFKKHHAKLYYLIGTIQNLLRSKDEYTSNSYVNLWSVVLLKVIGEDYRTYINILIHLGVIEANSNNNGGEIFSIEKGITKSYRLTQKYRKAKSEPFKVEDYQSKITSKLKKEIELTGSDDGKKMPYLQHVYDEFTERITTFDIENANRYIDYCRTHQIKLKDKVISKDGFYYVVKNRVFDDEVKKDYQQKVIAIQDKKIYFKKSSVNRVHNNYTELPNLLVPFIKDATGHSMKELDASTSLICILYRNLVKYAGRYQKEGAIKDMAVYKLELALLHHTLSYTPDQPEKLDIYNLILSKVNQPDWTRDDVKERMFSTFLFQKEEKDSIIKKAFESLFPNITNVIVHIRKDGHDVFSRDLMKLESKVFQQIWKRIPAEVPGCSWLPKHDALLIDRDSAEQIKQIMIEELSAFTGLNAWVKEKDHQVQYGEIMQKLDALKGYSSMKNVEYNTKVSSNVTAEMKQEKKVERLEKTINTPVNPDDIFDVISHQVAVEQLAEITVNKNNTNTMNINQPQKENNFEMTGEQKEELSMLIEKYRSSYLLYRFVLQAYRYYNSSTYDDGSIITRLKDTSNASKFTPEEWEAMSFAIEFWRDTDKESKNHGCTCSANEGMLYRERCKAEMNCMGELLKKYEKEYHKQLLSKVLQKVKQEQQEMAVV